MNTISEKKVCWVDKYVGAIVCIYLENWENETQTRYTNHIDFKHGKKLSFFMLVRILLYVVTVRLIRF